MLDLVENPPQGAGPEPDPPPAYRLPPLSRKGFITTYPMFRYWQKEAVAEGLRAAPLNLYIHMPYCIQRCAYCYFKTTTLKENRLQEIDRYVHSVLGEIELGARRFHLGERPVHTIYFGGGTPTLMTEENIDRLFAALHQNFTLAAPQITFEGEPVTLTERKAALLARHQVNRISLGIQSFKEEIVFQTGRQDTEAQTMKAIGLAKATGAMVNIDLISGLAHETAETWAYSIRRAIEADVHNITIYKLELYANTPLYSSDRKKDVTLPSEEEELEFSLYAAAELKQAGYRPINTFTFAKDGAYDQLHTRSKWRGDDNYAVGVSAFGSLGSWNYQNTSDINAYNEAIAAGTMPAIRAYNCTSLDLLLRDVVLGIKLLDLDLHGLQRKHGVDLLRVCEQEIGQLQEHGFVTVEGSKLALTERGILYGDYVGRVLEGGLKVLGGSSATSRARVLF